MWQRSRPLENKVHWSVNCTIGAIVTLLVTVSSMLAPRVCAQQPADSVRVATPPPGAPAPSPVVSILARNQPSVRVDSRGQPPLTSRRAFVYSLVLPGLGQSRLDRGSSGTLFASVELGAIVMLQRTAADVREARRYLTDTLPDRFIVAEPGSGQAASVQPSGKIIGRYTSDLVRTRRLHAEDWIAVLAFNHLISGADAFVSAQLWDMPIALSATPSMQGTMLVVTLRF